MSKFSLLFRGDYEGNSLVGYDFDIEGVNI